MIKQPEAQKKMLPEVMKEFNAVFSLSLSDGFANISFDDKGERVVTFLDYEGMANDEGIVSYQDVKKVAGFMEAMNDLQLKDFQQG